MPSLSRLWGPILTRKFRIAIGQRPFFGGRVHRVSGALRSPTGELCCKLSGTWDGTVEWEVTTEKQGDSQPLLCVSELSPKPRKRVRDLQKQDELESRRIWFNVAQALAEKDFNTADEHKKFLEQRQREIRQNEDERHAPRFFRQQGDTWIPISLNPSSA
ncbi:unnamed protein product [Cyprideis torosa]|uniref:Uncharacterized protein n=1 Tax=Cyprideis torosa TaxID=163714 RepID=A0A7R8WPH4_9CRUS|nr:unnamed protein product [Cyprideis torosa]CAG0905051.1 unnamed protein product [Cyprideis torosa]